MALPQVRRFECLLLKKLPPPNPPSNRYDIHTHFRIQNVPVHVGDEPLAPTSWLWNERFDAQMRKFVLDPFFNFREEYVKPAVGASPEFVAMARGIFRRFRKAIDNKLLSLWDEGKQTDESEFLRYTKMVPEFRPIEDIENEKWVIFQYKEVFFSVEEIL